MLALAGSLAFTACSDDDDTSPIINSATSFKGTSTATVMSFSIPMEDDVVTVAPMPKDKSMAQLTFAERTMSVNMGMASMNVKMDAFTIDSCQVAGSADNYTLTRNNAFAVSGVKVSLSGMESEQTVTGTLASAALADGVLTVKLADVKAHSSMPMTMTLEIEGQQVK